MNHYSKMRDLCRDILLDESGQGMTEYILVVVLVVLASITAFIYYRLILQGKWIGTGNQLYGATDDTCVH